MTPAAILQAATPRQHAADARAEADAWDASDTEAHLVRPRRRDAMLLEHRAKRMESDVAPLAAKDYDRPRGG
jgi:hypothetical protein